MTARGYAALLLGALLVVCGAVLGWSSLLAVAVVVLATAAASLLLAFVPSHPRVVRAAYPGVVQRGQAAQAELVAAAGFWPTLPSVVRDRVGEEPLPVAVPFLRPGAPRTVTYPLPTDRRGVFEVGPLVTAREDPFGLARRSRSSGEVLVLSVRPAVHEVRMRAVGGSRHSHGAAATTTPNGSAAFHALRPYVPGDDRRAVHWRTSARLDALMVRQGSEAADPEILIVLDSTAADAAAFEESVDLAASLMAGASREGLTVRLLDGGGLQRTVTPAPHAVERALDALAAVAITEARREVPAAVRNGSAALAVVVTTDRERVADDVRALAARGRAVVVAEVGTAAWSAADGGVLIRSAPDASSWCRLWGSA